MDNLFTGRYPYTDFHELNADWLIKRLNEVEARINGLKEEVEKDMKDYVDAQLAPYLAQLNQLIIQVNQLDAKVTQTLASYDQRITQFEADVNARILAIQNNIANQISAVNQLTDTKIAQNNIYILNEVQKNLGNVVQVVNPFTGTKVTIQEMVDTLAAFHIVDGIIYDTMNTRALTYTRFNALNTTYTNFLLHGNTIYV